ncbi:MAG TPA: AIR synthase related protein, partial [Blastocatellia bacterium]
MQSEFEFIKSIRDQATKGQAADLVLNLVWGIGDDAAILREREGRETLITVDLLVEEIDFKLEYAPPRFLGHKALAVSLSDIAAMGGAPAFSLLTLGIPKRFQISNPESQYFFEEF